MRMTIQKLEPNDDGRSVKCNFNVALVFIIPVPHFPINIPQQLWMGTFHESLLKVNLQADIETSQLFPLGSKDYGRV